MSGKMRWDRVRIENRAYRQGSEWVDSASQVLTSSGQLTPHSTAAKKTILQGCKCGKPVGFRGMHKQKCPLASKINAPAKSAIRPAKPAIAAAKRAIVLSKAQSERSRELQRMRKVRSLKPVPKVNSYVSPPIAAFTNQHAAVNYLERYRTMSGGYQCPHCKLSAKSSSALHRHLLKDCALVPVSGKNQR